MNRLKAQFQEISESLWFVPGLMICLSIVLALLLIDTDTRIGRDPFLEYSLVFGLGADGSRGMLTAIASSMLTVATLAFSLTLNALAQVSSQYSPRIIRNFLSDRANQFVLGYFVSVFVYCLLVLRTIRGGDEGSFVPSLAIFAGLVFALGGVLVLIFFIHHIAASLQISNIISRIVDDSRVAVDRMFPETMGSPARVEESPEETIKEFEWVEVCSRESGYIQMIATDEFLAFAKEKDLVLKLECKLGDFIGTGAPLVSVAKVDASGRSSVIDNSIDELNEMFVIGPDRTLSQDVEFGIRQMVDIALKALSPGVNDTTTAVTCINNIGEILGSLAQRRFPERIRSDNGRPLVIAIAPRFENYVDEAFDQIMVNGRGNFAVFERLGAAILYVASRTGSRKRLDVLAKKLDEINDFANESLETLFEVDRVTSDFRSMRFRLADRRHRMGEKSERLEGLCSSKTGPAF